MILLWMLSHYTVPRHGELSEWGSWYTWDYKWFFHGFQFSSSWSAYKTSSLRSGIEGSHLSKWIPWSYTKGQSRRATIQGSQVWARGSGLGPLLFLAYANDICRNTDLNKVPGENMVTLRNTEFFHLEIEGIIRIYHGCYLNRSFVSINKDVWWNPIRYED
jgi:hypothetical protein